MESVTLFEEYRLIERSDFEINGAWNGAHLLLFFLAFVFGSFCTFCFHMLMYLFDEKCVLFPKLLSLTSLRQNIIYEFIPEDKEIADMLPVDFLSTQWVDKSACYLPTYVPLVSGIFGLVWTTMFLMCSTGSRTLTGLQRPWRVLLPVFVFSLAMGGLCLYATIVTHNGLQELCIKLGEITGSSTCTYTVNVATLAYERRIRGVYQATRITILSAWLHTMCWLLSALLTICRVLLAVDFQLVKVSAQLKGNIDEMLERHETQIKTVSPDAWITNESSSRSRMSSRSQSSVKVHFQKKDQESRFADTSSLRDEMDRKKLFTSSIPKATSDSKYNSVPKDTINLPKSSLLNILSKEASQSETKLTRQYGQQNIASKWDEAQNLDSDPESQEIEEIAFKITRELEKRIMERFNEYNDGASTSRKALEFESIMNLTSELKQVLEGNLSEQSSGKLTSNVQQQIDQPRSQSEQISKPKKSNLKNKNTQTDETGKRKPSPKVKIVESPVTDVVNDPEIEIDPQSTKTVKEKPKKEKED